MRSPTSRRSSAAIVLAAVLVACGSEPTDGVTDPTPDPTESAENEEPADTAGPEAPADADAVEADAAPFDPSLDHLARETVTLTRAADGADIEVAVTLPATQEERRQGLMGVPELADGTGMLFDFGAERTGSFWMKDTLVPLDIAFADEDGEVLVVLAMEPCLEDPCPSYDPGIAYRYALEVPQGWFAANDLGPGDRLIRSSND